MRKGMRTLVLSAAMGMSCAAAWAEEEALPQLDLDLPSGVYRCEEGTKQLGVERVRQDSDKVVVRWEGKRYTLARDVSFSGLPRYEDRQTACCGLTCRGRACCSTLRPSARWRPIASMPKGSILPCSMRR